MNSRIITLIAWLLLNSLTIYVNALTVKQQSADLNGRLKTAKGNEKVEILLRLATHFNPDSVVHAFALTRQAIAEGNRLPDKFLFAKANVYMASLFLRTYTFPDSAYAYLMSAEKAFAGSGSGKPTASYFYNLARYHNQTSDTIKAFAIGQVAVEMAEKENDYYTAALAQMLMGKISRRNGDVKGFVEWLGRAEKSFLLSEDKTLAGPAMISLGVLYKDAGLHEKGDKVLIKATALCEQSGDSLYLGYLYCNVSSIFQSGPDKDKSLLFLKKAVAIFQALNNDRGLGYAYNHLGLNYRWHKKFNDALSCFSRSIECKTRIGDWQGACFAACNKAEIFMEKRRYDEITSILGEAEEFMKRSGDKLSATVYYNTSARFRVMNKEYTNALADFNLSLHFARESFDQNFLLENLKAIAELYQSMGDESQALRYFKSYIAAGDSMKDASSEQSYKDMQDELNIATSLSSDDKVTFRKVLFWLKDAAIPITIIIMVMVMWLSVWAFRRNTVFSEPEKPADQADAGDELQLAAIDRGTDGNRIRPLLSEPMRNDIWLRLNQLMEDEKCFLRSDISLYELATKLGTNTTYLSKVINELTGYNFNSFVNKYRVEEACKRLMDPRQQYLSIEGIARSAGFNSKSAFNAAFRKIKGMTPSEYCESLQSQIQQLS